jgi:uncharacterized protein (DUF58 family)
MNVRSKTLTNRGRGFLAIGLGVIFTAILIGEKDLIAVAIMLVAVPIAAVILLTFQRFRLATTRYITPAAHVPAGSTVQVTIELDNLTSYSTPLLLFEDQLPFQLGSQPRFRIEGLPARGQTQTSYQLSPMHRGIYQLGPLQVHASDPFGMSILTRTFDTVNKLIVTPKVIPLSIITTPGGWAGSGRRAIAMTKPTVRSEPDLIVRQFRIGDDVRKVHWRASARAGELMVRPDIPPRNTSALVILDTRAGVHRGKGTNSSFEWAVTAAASICVHLAQLGFHVSLITSDGNRINGSADHILTYLASIKTSNHRMWKYSTVDDETSLTVGILGTTKEYSFDSVDLTTLNRFYPSAGRGLALMLDVGSWTTGQPTGTNATVSIDELINRGWRVGLARRHDSVADVWAELATPVLTNADRSAESPL